jgi:hypothetical protein
MTENLAMWLASEPSDVNQWLAEGLKAGCDYLGMSTGIVSQINNKQYVIQAVYSTLGDVFTPGISFELQNTYCDAVVRAHKPVTYIHVGSIPSMVLHPVYTSVQLESYIGVPLENADNDIVGTLNFSSHDIRPFNFDNEEIAMVEKMAAKINQQIS